MWEIRNATRYQADAGWVRDKSGREVWLVAVRARFRIVPGREAIWDEDLPQDPVKLAPEFAGSGVSCHLVADSDLVHEKQATDVLMVGHACAPRGHLSTRLTVGMAVGPVRKSVSVVGDRLWTLGGMSDPVPFERMPLDYTRAFGGIGPGGDPAAPADWCADNPVGRGYALRAAALEARRLPNIEDPAQPFVSPSDRPRPAGFGAIAPHWPARSRHAGTYDEAWEKERLPLLPLDFDPRFHQQAPPDQQVPGFLRGGEAVRLEGVHSDGSLEFFLPRVSLAFETAFDDLTEATHRANLHTVVFEPDILAVSMVWHTSLECHAKVTMLDETRVWERRRVRVRRLEQA
jgi:hypothetical protein